MTTSIQAPPRPGAVAAAILLVQFVTPLSIAGIAVGLPGIARDLGAAPGPLQWAVNGFNVSFALFTLVWGGLADRFGYRRCFRLGIGIALAGSVLSAVSPTLVVLDAARILTGAGAAAIITSATALLSQLYSGTARARVFTAFGAINGLGLAAGPTISGVLLSVGDWRLVFAVHAALLALGGVGSLLVPRGGTAAAPRARGGARALLNPGYVAMVIVPVAGAAGFVTLLTYMPTALQAVRGDSPGRAGLLMLAMTLPVLVLPPLLHRFAHARPMAVSALALACLVAAPLVLLSFDEASPLWVLLLAFLLAGLGFGLPLGIVDGQALGFVPPAQQGAAAGVLNFFRIGSEAVFVAAYAAVLGLLVAADPRAGGAAGSIAAGEAGHPEVYLGALRPTLLGMAAVTLVLLLAFLALAARSRGARAAGGRPARRRGAARDPSPPNDREQATRRG